MDKSATLTFISGTVATSVTSAFVVGIYSAVACHQHPALIAGWAAMNSGMTAATFFGLREFCITPALTHFAPWPEYARRREELGIPNMGLDGADSTHPQGPSSLNNLRTNKLLDSGISGAVTGGLVRGLRSGKRAVLPGAAMAGLACVALQYGFNRFTMSRLRTLAQPVPETPPEPELPLRDRVLKVFGLSAVPEEEYLKKLKNQRDTYQKRIDDLLRLAELEEAKKDSNAGAGAPPAERKNSENQK